MQKLEGWDDIVSSRQSLSDLIAEEIKNKIMFGVYHAGEQIPNEYDIAKEYNVSRFTVREAIKKISTTGLVKIERGRGTYVNKISPASFMKPLLPMLILDDNDFKEICEARLAIERYTVLLCVDKAEITDIRKLEDMIKDMEGYLNNEKFDAYNGLDMEFHTEIARISGNRILYEIFMTIKELLEVEIKRVSVAPNANNKSIEIHKRIVEAIKMKDRKSAVASIETHIQDAIDYLAEQERIQLGKV